MDTLPTPQVGIAPFIKRLAHDNPRVNLALSLHAPNQDLRKEIVPNASKAYNITKLMGAVDYYIEETIKARAGEKKKKSPGIMMQVCRNGTKSVGLGRGRA